MAKRAEETSNLESDDGKLKQKRKQSSKFLSDCEDGDGTVLQYNATAFTIYRLHGNW